MKHTKVMLACLSALFVTWMVLGGINYLFNNEAQTFKQAVTHGGVLMLMVFIGWIPSIVVGYDVSEKLEL